MRILVTGAAGLIGGELTARLLEQGHCVVAIVHRSSEILANDGALLAGTPWHRAPCEAGQLVLLHGDVSRPRFGLREADVDVLAQTIDLVIHCAAVTAFDAPPDRYHDVNVLGTSHALQLCPDAGFLHVSTAYVCGVHSGPVAEARRDPAADFANGYEASKAAAEALVMVAGGEGRAVAIARPSIVVGDHDEGRIRSFDTIYAAFRLIAEGRISALPATDDATLDFVPICHVVGGLTDIVAHWHRAAGGIFHLASGNPVSVQRWVDAIGTFSELSAPRLVPPALFDEARLPPLERRLYRRTASLYASYFERDPRFVTANLAALSDRVCPPVDDAALGRMIGFCLDRGFLKVA